MAAHCLMHAGAMWVITGSLSLALVEFVLHWIIDVAKCSGKTNFHIDQLMHYTCKLIYALLIYIGWQPPF
jgi:hypothetical protein